jgi:mannose-1-phosphate guanylyltransferase
MNRIGKPWAIILAGGSGERLRSVTASPDGQTVPKQFCRFAGRDSMIEIALSRARRLTSAGRILVVVRDDHRPWWESELADVPPNNVLVHTQNRGTGVALLHAMLCAIGRDPGAVFVVLSSDHAVDHEGILREAILEAVAEAERSSRHVILLGAPSETPDSSLGWIIPGRPGMGRTRMVSEFVEKPGLAQAAECVRRGGLRNTLILAGSARALLSMYAIRALGERGAFRENEHAFHVRAQALASMYPYFPAMDIGRDILQRSARWLRVLPLPECGWADIGTVDRLQEWWRRHPAAWEEAKRTGILPRAREIPPPVRGLVAAHETAELVVSTGTDGPLEDDTGRESAGVS